MRNAAPTSGTVAAEIRAEIARQRKRLGDVATALGMSRPTLYRRLSGQVPFDVEQLYRLADLLDVPASHFLPAAPASTDRSVSAPPQRAPAA